jgi:magnesium chelatase accessory protein
MLTPRRCRAPCNPAHVADAPRWDVDGADWPNRANSRFVMAGGLRWHVQQMGSGPILLLVHGTGAATHSWRALAPLLAAHFTVVAPDLPGHGFTAMPPPDRSATALSLPGMAHGLAGLLRTLGVTPQLAVGHSAGAAILARMCLDGAIAPAGLVSLNGAFLPLGGPAARFLSPVAKLLARSPLVPQLFAWHVADPKVAERLMRGTGSAIDPAGMDFYARLMRRSGHAAAALAMMANWELQPLQRDLRRLKPRLLLVVGANDRTIPPDNATRVAALVPGAELVSLPGLGHLAHEEKPADIAGLIEGFARSIDVPPG